jgi:hypothetical protein
MPKVPRPMPMSEEPQHDPAWPARSVLVVHGVGKGGERDAIDAMVDRRIADGTKVTAQVTAPYPPGGSGGASPSNANFCPRERRFE